MDYSRDVRFDYLGIEDGLSDRTVTCIAKDSPGFLWFGTQEGLNRYDGNRFKIFRHDPDDSASLASSFIMALLVSRTGDLWVGTTKGGLNRFDYRTETFARFGPPYGPFTTLENDITSLGEDRQGIIWIGTRSGGLCSFDPRSSKVMRYIHNPADQESVSHNCVWSIGVDPFDNLWIGTGNGVNRLPSSRTGFVRYPFLSPNEAVRRIYCGPSGVVWCGAETGIYRHNPARNAFERVRFPVLEHPSIGKIHVLSFLEDTEGNQWIGTDKGGFILPFHDRMTPQRVRSFLGGFKYNVFSTAFEDRTGILWFSGIEKYDPERSRFNATVLMDPRTDTPSQFGLRAICEDEQGGLWISMYDHGLVHRTPQGNEFELFLPDASKKGWLAQSRIRSIVEWNGEIWMGGVWGGIEAYHPGSKTFRKIQELKSHSVHWLFVDKEGVLWAAGDEVWRYDGRTRKFVIHAFAGQGTQNLKALRTMFEDRKGRLWFGTESRGAIMVDRATGASRRFVNIPSDKTSIGDDGITCILEDERGTIWIGTASAGINRFNELEMNFIRFTQKQGLPNNDINGILSDGSGNLWISSNSGISRFNLATHKIRNFDIADGISSRAYHRNAFHKARDGRLFFGGNGAFDEFFPDSIRDRNFKPRIVLTDFVVNDSISYPVAGRPSGSTFDLPYDQNTLEVEFAALDFVNPRKIQYAYRLEGLENGWVYPGNRHRVRYAGLSPANYLLKIRATNSEGEWTSDEFTATVVIVPPWWKTRWAIALFILVGTAFLTVFVSNEMRRLRKEKRLQQVFTQKQMESQDAERKRLASELHDSLGQDLLIVNNELQQLQQNGTAPSSGIDRIKELIQESIEEVREISSSLHPHQIERLGFCAAVKAMVEKVSHASGMTVRWACDQQSIQLPKHAQIHAYRVIQESLSNAVRYASATEIGVEVRRTDGKIDIVVRDNGIGFQTDRPQSPTMEGQPPGHRGFGIPSMTERARIAGGTFVLESAPGRGTTVHLTLPAEKESP